MPTSTRTRIAPSPTGFPHIGTIYQGLFDYVYAKKHSGKFIIRIEDTDQKRQVKGAEEVIYQALEYFGLTPDEGPKYGGKFGPYRQSERLSLYQQHAQELVSKGHAYYCFCTPEELADHRQKMQQAGRPPMYSKKCRQLSTDLASTRSQKEPHVIRMKIPSDKTITLNDVIRGNISFDSNIVDDQVILKSDGFPTYHLAVVVDDHHMKISHVVRGEEWISSAPKHILIYQYFGWDLPVFIHLPLLRNPDRSKISKRHGHTSAQWYQDEGYLVEAVINFLATRVWNHPEGKEVFSINEIIKHFEFKDMHIQGPIVDINKLDWLNGQWIRNMSNEELLDRAMPYTSKDLSRGLLAQILPLIKERLVKLSQIKEFTDYFITSPEPDPDLLVKMSKMDSTETAIYLQRVVDALDTIDNWQSDQMENKLRQLQQQLQLKPRPAFMTIRVAVTGKETTPPLFDVMHVLGKRETLARIKSSIDILHN